MTDLLDRYELAASLLARQRVRLALAPGRDRPWVDGRTIHVLPGEPDDVRRQVLAGAALLGAGALADDSARAARSRVRERLLRFEACRAEAVVRSRFPGLAPGGAPAEGAPPDAAASLALARSGAPAPEVAWWWGDVRAAPTEPAEVQAPPLELSGQLGPPTDEQGDRDGGDDVLSRLLEQIGRRRRRSGGARSDGSEPRAASTFVASVGRRARRGSGTALTAADLTATEPDPEPGVHTYPEWDHRTRTYRPRWCTVREVAAVHVPGPRPEVLDLRDELAHLGLVHGRVTHQPDGDDIDLDRCIDATIDALVGVEPHPSWHVARLRRRRDLAVAILVDTSDSVRDPAPDGRRIHDHQVEAVLSLAQAIEQLGGSVAVHAFSSMGRHHVQLVRCAWFGRNPGDDLPAALRALEPGARTRLGAAIRHGATLLRRHGGATHRLMIVVTDGFAYDDGYEGERGREDARRALLEARREGIASVCLSLGSPLAPAELAQVFGTTAHAHAEDLAGLRHRLRAVTSSALHDAERTRRRHTKEATRG